MANSENLSLYGLIYSCPFGFECSPCPFDDIRQKTLNDRFDQIEELQQEEIDRMMNMHLTNYHKNFDFDKLKNGFH